MAEQVVYRSVPMDHHRQFFSVQRFDDGTVRIGLERSTDGDGGIYFAIDATPTGHMAFLVTAFGKPFTSNGFGNWFKKRCTEAGLPHCSAHGLRKAGTAVLAERGATDREIMAVTGHVTSKEVDRYTRSARQKTLAAAAIRRSEGGTE